MSVIYALIDNILGIFNSDHILNIKDPSKIFYKHNSFDKSNFHNSKNLFYQYSLCLPFSYEKGYKYYLLSDTVFNIGDRFILNQLSSDQNVVDLSCISNINIANDDNKILQQYYSITNNNNISQVYKSFISNLSKLLPKELNYKDQTQLDTFNIDPPNSRDFDDAITIEDHKIYIHITDFESKIKCGSDIDISAFLLNQTLYLPDTEPLYMLPRDLACNELSLIKDKDRNVLTVEFIIDSENNVCSSSIYPSIIHIKNRYDYETPVFKESKDTKINWISEFILKNKFSSYEVPIPCYKLTNGKIENNTFIIKKDNKDSYEYYNKYLISTLMILANSYVSKYLSEYIHTPERFHPQPVKQPSDTEISDLSETVQTKLLIKDNKRAYYTPGIKGHYGLDLKDYTHFTSPARRFLDTIIQRLIWCSFESSKNDILKFLSSEKQSLDMIIEYCNIRQLINKKIQNYIKFLNIYRMVIECDNNSIWNAVIIDCNQHGITCYIESLLIETKIHVSNLGKEYFTFNHNTKELIGKTLKYKIGDTVTLKNPKAHHLYTTLTFQL